MVERIRMSRWRLLGASLLCVPFTLFGADLIYDNEAVAGLVLGWIAVIFFGGGGVVMLVSIIRPRVVLTLDNDGVHIGSKIFHRWEDIRHVRVEGGTRSSTKMASLVLRRGVEVKWGRDVLPVGTRGGPDCLAEQIRNHPGYARRAGRGTVDRG